MELWMPTHYLILETEAAPDGWAWLAEEFE